jgi:hypothetical protein
MSILKRGLSKSLRYLGPTNALNAAKSITLELPEGGYNGGMLTKEILANMFVLKTCYHITLRSIQEYLESEGIKLSLGTINNYLKAISRILRPVYLELLENAKTWDKVSADETSHRLGGLLRYTWVFVGDDTVVYKIGTREADMLEKVLGSDFEGVITSDYFTSYRCYAKDKPNVVHQFCLAYVKLYII